jgi:hypothetical protein
MTQLNSVGEALGQQPGVHAMTDVTGFGLCGHLLEVLRGSRLAGTMQYDKVCCRRSLAILGVTSERRRACCGVMWGPAATDPRVLGFY